MHSLLAVNTASRSWNFSIMQIESLYVMRRLFRHDLMNAIHTYS
jgi:hypothetical protein